MVLPQLGSWFHSLRLIASFWWSSVFPSAHGRGLEGNTQVTAVVTQWASKWGNLHPLVIHRTVTITDCDAQSEGALINAKPDIHMPWASHTWTHRSVDILKKSINCTPLLNLPLLLGLCDINSTAQGTNCDIYDIWQWMIIAHSTKCILMALIRSLYLSLLMLTPVCFAVDLCLKLRGLSRITCSNWKPISRRATLHRETAIVHFLHPYCLLFFPAFMFPKVSIFVTT